MNKIFRIVITALCLLCVVALCACGDDTQTPSTDNGTPIDYILEDSFTKIVMVLEKYEKALVDIDSYVSEYGVDDNVLKAYCAVSDNFVNVATLLKPAEVAEFYGKFFSVVSECRYTDAKYRDEMQLYASDDFSLMFLLSSGALKADAIDAETVDDLFFVRDTAMKMLTYSSKCDADVLSVLKHIDKFTENNKDKLAAYSDKINLLTLLNRATRVLIDKDLKDDSMDKVKSDVSALASSFEASFAPYYLADAMNKKDQSAAEGYFADIMTATADNAELCDKNLSLVYAFEKRAEKDTLKISALEANKNAFCYTLGELDDYAKEAGFLQGDVLLKVGDSAIYNASQLYDLTNSGTAAEFTVLRAGEEIKVNALSLDEIELIPTLR